MFGRLGGQLQQLVDQPQIGRIVPTGFHVRLQTRGGFKARAGLLYQYIRRDTDIGNFPAAMAQLRLCLRPIVALVPVTAKPQAAWQRRKPCDILRPWVPAVWE